MRSVRPSTYAYGRGEAVILGNDTSGGLNWRFKTSGGSTWDYPFRYPFVGTDAATDITSAFRQEWPASPSSSQVFSFTHATSPTLDKMYMNGDEYSKGQSAITEYLQGSTAAIGRTGNLYIGYNPQSSSGIEAYFFRICAADSQQSDDDVARTVSCMWGDAFDDGNVVPFQGNIDPARQAIFVGDSITQLTAPDGLTWVQQLTLDYSLIRLNFGMAGAFAGPADSGFVPTFYANYKESTTGYYSKTSQRSILVVMIGSNDLERATTDTDYAAAVSQVVNTHLGLGSNTAVVLLPVLARRTTQDTLRASYNAKLAGMAAANPLRIFYLDPTTIPLIAANGASNYPSGNSYFTDGVHLTGLGKQYLATAVAPVVNSIDGTLPPPFPYVDPSSVFCGTAYSGEWITGDSAYCFKDLAALTPVSSDGDAVRVIKGKKYGHRFVQPASANAALWKTGVVNGKSVLRYNSSSASWNSLEGNPLGVIDAFHQLTVFVVARQTDGVGSLEFIYGAGDGSGGDPLLFVPDGSNQAIQAYPNALQDTGIGQNNWAVYVIQYTGTLSAAGAVKYWINGGSNHATIAAVRNGLSDTADVTLGMIDRIRKILPLVGDIRQILWCNKACTLAEINHVGADFAVDVGLTWNTAT
jgi:lysophospholipase L1-like esterase